MAHQVVTETVEEASTAEEAVNARIEAEDFVPSAPLNAVPAAYVAGTTYAKGVLVMDGAQAYRSLAAGNKGHTPHEDENAHWVPVAISVVPLVNPAYNHTPSAGAGLGE